MMHAMLLIHLVEEIVVCRRGSRPFSRARLERRKECVVPCVVGKRYLGLG